MKSLPGPETLYRPAYSKIKALENRILACDKCPRLRRINPFPMPHIPYRGEGDNIHQGCFKFMGIGRSPGLEDSYVVVGEERFMQTYRHNFYECRFGRYVRKMVGGGLLKQKFFFTNICKCPSPQNSSLLPQEIDKCRIGDVALGGGSARGCRPHQNEQGHPSQFPGFRHFTVLHSTQGTLDPGNRRGIARANPDGCQGVLRHL